MINKFIKRSTSELDVRKMLGYYMGHFPLGDSLFQVLKTFMKFHKLNLQPHLQLSSH